MWEPNDVWKTYSRYFGDLEAARTEWSQLTLRFLNVVSEKTTNAEWAKGPGLVIKNLNEKDWYQRANVDHLRRSEQFTLGSGYRFRITIGFKATADTQCAFYVHVDPKLKDGAALRNREQQALKQFVEEHERAHLDTSDWTFLFETIDATMDNFGTDVAVAGVKRATEELPQLKNLLEATGKRS
jgi:hypothetical protein